LRLHHLQERAQVCCWSREHIQVLGSDLLRYTELLGSLSVAGDDGRPWHARRQALAEVRRLITPEAYATGDASPDALQVTNDQ
jgi:hypothetical protein